MFSKNLKYFRLKNELSKNDLADRINVTPMAITHYESGTRKPDMSVVKKMAEVLGVRVADFLAVRNENLVFSHGDFRKNSTLSAAQQEYVRECVEEYFNRFMMIVEVLGGEVLPNAPKTNKLHLSEDNDANAQALRMHLGLAVDGPISNFVELLENKGILVYLCEMKNDRFYGMNLCSRKCSRKSDMLMNLVPESEIQLDTQHSIRAMFLFLKKEMFSGSSSL